MIPAFLHISDLSYHFTEGAQAHAVLDGVELSINRGEMVALLGRSGCGKSTLLNLISAIAQAEKGQICINDMDLTALSERDSSLFRRRHIGFIYQLFNLIPTLSAAENIALILQLNNYSNADIKDRVYEVLCHVGLEHRADSFPDQLSGGEQQRIAIARAIVHKPELVLADEPTGNLDAQTGQQILSLLRELVTASSATLILVTHSLAVAKTADRILTLEDGKLAECGDDFAW
jgi:putative ABC transport system ATP-binding protein